MNRESKEFILDLMYRELEAEHEYQLSQDYAEPEYIMRLMKAMTEYVNNYYKGWDKWVQTTILMEKIQKCLDERKNIVIM